MLKIDNVSAQYRTISGPVKAIENISFTIFENEIFGIAGESGCGKSTLIKVLYDLISFPLELTKGKVEMGYKSSQGKEITVSSGNIKNAWWEGISYVPQAAMSVLNPVYKIEDQFFEVIQRHQKKVNKQEMYTKIKDYLQELDLPESVLKAYPHQLSGGMRQRVIIALATFLHPNFILADEPTTALDVVVQKNIILLLMDLQEKMKNSLVIVSHDMGVHYQMTHRMAIMYAGSVVELGKTNDIFSDPLHPYTKMLISALPRVGDKNPREGIPGSPPSLKNPPPGCRFAQRCSMAQPSCNDAIPEFREIRPGRFVACHLL